MKALCLFVGLLGATIIASVPPDFSPDSQLYVQSGFLWARGDVTFAASFVGSRIFDILYYHLPIALLGPSIDAISIALGFAFLAYAALVTVWSFKQIGSTYIAASVALAAIIIGFIWLPWHFPLTEQIALAIILAVLYLLSLSNRADGSVRWLPLLAAAGICGAGLGVRSELAILFVLIAGSALFDGSKLFRTRAVLFAAMIPAFGIAAQIPPLAFNAFSGKPMPHQLSNYFFFYQALHEFGDAKNGPASAELASLGEKVRPTLSQTVQTSDVDLGIGPSFARNGAQITDRLARDAGIETIRARPIYFTKYVLYILRDYLYASHFYMKVDWRSYEDRWRDAKDKIEAVDDHRASLSARFGGDSLFPVAPLFEQRLFVSPSFGGFPIVDIRPPALLITIIAIIAMWMSALNRNFSAPALIAAVYFFACAVLSSVSQGYVTRYFMAASLPLVIVFAIEIGRRLSDWYYAQAAVRPSLVHLQR